MSAANFKNVKEEICALKPKLVRLDQLEKGLTNVLTDIAKGWEPISLRSARNPKNDALIISYTPEQQAQVAVSKIMYRIWHRMNHDIVTTRDLPYYTRPTEKPQDTRNVSIDNISTDKANSFVELRPLFFGGDNGWSVTGSIYLQPRGAAGCRETTFGKKILSQDQVSEALIAAAGQCQNFTSQKGKMIHHFAAASAPMFMATHPSEITKWREMREYEVQGNLGPSPLSHG